MSLGITDEHVELAASLRRWAAGLGAVAAVRAAEGEPDEDFADVWKAAVEMGVPTIGLPEAAGGGGGSVMDVAVALEACAHELVPGPLLGAALAAWLLGDSPVAGAVGDGARVGVAAAGETVWDAPGATHVLLSRDQDAWYVLPRADVVVTPVVGLDLSRRYGLPEALDGVEAGVRVDGLTADRVRRAAVTLGAAEAAGVARWCLETAVEYAKVREQFGRPIGSFQAVKHLCAEMLETAEAVTAAAWDVAAAAPISGSDDPQWAFAADVAEAVCFDGAVEVAKSCIQVLGGIGFTFEHDAHLYLRRALALRGLLADGDAPARLAARAVDGRTPSGRARPRGPRRAGPGGGPGPGRGDRGGAGRPAPGRPRRGGLPGPALAGAARARRGRRDADRHRPGAGPGRCRAARPGHRRVGGPDDPRARH